MKDYRKYHPVINFVFHLLPGSISILQVESLNVYMFIHSPIKSSNLYLMLWVILQSLVGIVYAKISDNKQRKKVMVWVQLFGIPLCASLALTGYSWLIPLILVGIFNPLPVAKATLLDNFPQYSPLRLIALTYLFQYFPWFLFSYIKYVDVMVFIYMQIGILIVNSILTYFFVRDDYAVGHKISSHESLRGTPKAVYILVAFMFAEAAFYFIWAVMEHHSNLGAWFTPTTLAMLLGILFIMTYSKITHISLITLSYFGCFGGMFLALYLFYYMGADGRISSIAIISASSLFGGLYLPLVTDAIILHFGGKRKAFAASIVELFDSVAQGIGTSIPLIGSAIGLARFVDIPYVFFIMGTLFLGSSLIQKVLVRDTD